MSVDVAEPLDDARRDSLIDSMAHKVVGRRLEAPAVLFLEMHKPLSFIASQSLMVAMPFLGPLVGPDRMADLGKLLQDRENVERLIVRIEELSMERDASAEPAVEEQR